MLESETKVLFDIGQIMQVKCTDAHMFEIDVSNNKGQSSECLEQNVSRDALARQFGAISMYHST